MLCIQQLTLVGYNNSTIAEKLQAFFEKTFKKGAKCCTFGTTHKSRRDSLAICRSTKRRGVSNENTINFRKLLSGSCTAEKAVLR